MEIVGMKKPRGVVKNASSAMPSDLKYENRWQVLKVFRDGREYTANEVAAITGISRQTTMKAIRFFCNRGLLHFVGKGDSTTIGGKKPECFAFSRQSYLLCITMWPSTINLTLFDLVRRKLDYEEHPVTEPLSLDDAFSRLATFIHAFLQKNGKTSADIYGVGLSIAGTVDYKTGNMLYNAYAPQWGRDIPLASRLCEILGEDVVVYVENAGKAVGRAVLLDGDDIKKKRVMTLFTQWGTSACIIERGHVLNGKDSLIGEIGRMYLDEKDVNGRYVSLESMISEEAMHEMLKMDPPPQTSPLSAFMPEQVPMHELFACSGDGDAYAQKIVERLARKVALAVHNINFLVNPDIVVFHGIYSHADEHFDNVFRKAVAELDAYPGECTFQTVYDKRPVYELDAIGLTTALSNFFFRADSLYEGEG